MKENENINLAELRRERISNIRNMHTRMEQVIRKRGCGNWYLTGVRDSTYTVMQLFAELEWVEPTLSMEKYLYWSRYDPQRTPEAYVFWSGYGRCRGVDSAITPTVIEISSSHRLRPCFTAGLRSGIDTDPFKLGTDCRTTLRLSLGVIQFRVFLDHPVVKLPSF